jgi:hypothetical protein
VFANISEEKDFQWIPDEHFLRLNFNLARLRVAKEAEDWNIVVEASKVCIKTLESASRFLNVDTSYLPETASLKVSLAYALLKLDTDKTEEAILLLESAKNVFTICHGKDSAQMDNILSIEDSFGMSKKDPKKKNRNKKGKSRKQ